MVRLRTLQIACVNNLNWSSTLIHSTFSVRDQTHQNILQSGRAKIQRGKKSTTRHALTQWRMGERVNERTSLSVCAREREPPVIIIISHRSVWVCFVCLSLISSLWWNVHNTHYAHTHTANQRNRSSGAFRLCQFTWHCCVAVCKYVLTTSYFLFSLVSPLTFSISSLAHSSWVRCAYARSLTRTRFFFSFLTSFF